MRGKKLILLALVAVMVALVPLVVFAKHTGTATGHAKMHPENQSGIKGRIDFVDNGNTLTVNGTATGLTPNQSYRSLIYGVFSVPGGPDACKADGTLPGTMFLGFWVNNNDGTGTLAAVNTSGGYVPLSAIGTISIRFPGGQNPNVQACGQVAVHKGG